MIAILLCLALQDDLSAKGRRAVDDLQAVFEVESQIAASVEDLRATAAALDRLRAAPDRAEQARLEREWGRFERRLQAERLERQLKAGKLIAILEAGLKEAPDDRGLLEARVQLAEHSPFPAEWARALMDVDALLKMRPGHRPYLILRGAFLRLHGKLKEAAEHLAEVLKAEPDNVRAHAYAGLIAFDAGDPERARAHLAPAWKRRAELRPVLAARLTFTQTEDEIREKERAAKDLPRVEFETPRGKIVVELFENEAPNTVANFIELAEKRFFDGTKFHRVEPNFVAQGGDPNSRDEDPDNDGQGGPGYKFADEIGSRARRHFRGSLSMANSGPHTNGSQFFITHRVTEQLDGRHTVFGRVVEGMDVVDGLRLNDALTAVRVLRKRDHPYRVKR